MPGLAHDGHLGGAIEESLGGEAGAQAVAGIVGGIEIRRGRGALDQAGDGAGIQAARGHAAVAIHCSKSRTGGEARGGDLGAVTADRAGGGGRAVRQGYAASLPFRIRFRTPDANDQPVGGFGDVLDIQAGQFRAPESAGKADQQQSAAADADEAAIEVVEHCQNIGGEERLFSELRGAQHPADAFDRLADGGMLHGGRRGKAGSLVRPGDGGEFAGEAGRLMIRGQRRHVESHGFGRRREGRQALAPAPGFKKAPVGAVGAACIVGLGGGDEPTGLFGQVFQGNQCPAPGLGDNQVIGHA